MHIVVFGAGAIGGYFGGRLAQAGEKVTFIARGEHLQAMLADGLHVESINGNFIIQPVSATEDIARAHSIDVILVCVKAWQIPKAAKAITAVMHPDTLVVPLENGVEAPTQLAEILGRGHVLGGLCRIASPGHIQHTGIDPYIAFGELDNRPSARCQDLFHCFTDAGVLAEIPLDINVAIWQKFLFVSALSGIGAVTRVPVGSYRSQLGTRQMLEDALQECYSVAIAHGIPLPANSVTNTLTYIDTLPPDTFASMQRDIMDGHPSELDAQTGAIVRLGQLHQIPTPVHSFIYNALIPQENLARHQID